MVRETDMDSLSTAEKIDRKMRTVLAAQSVEVIDEGWKHVGHGATGHFVLRVVSSRFEGVSRLDRNRMVFAALSEEMGGPIHALSVQAQTPAEAQEGVARASRP